MFFNYLKQSFTSSMEVVLHQAYWSATLSLMCTLLTLPLSSAWTRPTQPRTYQCSIPVLWKSECLRDCGRTMPNNSCYAARECDSSVLVPSLHVCTQPAKPRSNAMQSDRQMLSILVLLMLKWLHDSARNIDSINLSTVFFQFQFFTVFTVFVPIRLQFILRRLRLM